ncbi:MAG: hypothetical protein Q8L55_13530 [Phycisphaerales bacterium]|nr:hypothetical protein [Phycisphaerales bacterium]
MIHTMKLFAAAAACALAGTVQAGINFPPPWANWAQQGATTHWYWNFSNGPNNPQGQGVPGTPPPQITFTGGATWVQPNATQPGVICIPGGGSVVVCIPNYDSPIHQKFIWVQTDYFGGPEPVISAGFGPAGSDGGPWGPTVTPSPSPTGGLISGAGWQLPFCPPGEYITISNPNPGSVTYITWLNIDTICISTPGSAALLGAGSLLALRRRR